MDTSAYNASLQRLQDTLNVRTLINDRLWEFPPISVCFRLWPILTNSLVYKGSFMKVFSALRQQRPLSHEKATKLLVVLYSFAVHIGVPNGVNSTWNGLLLRRQYYDALQKLINSLEILSTCIILSKSEFARSINWFS